MPAEHNAAMGLGAPVCYAPSMRASSRLALVGLLLGLTACPPRSTPRGPARRGSGQAVEVTLTSLAGAPLPLSSFRGKPLVLMFFTAWCVPCQVQGARYQRVRAAVGPHRVTFLAVSVDAQRDLVPTFLEAAGIDFSAAYADAEMVRQSPVGPIRDVPRTLVLDREGRLVVDLQGPVEPKALLLVLKTLL